MRRRFLQAAGLSALALATYSYQRGIRFPTLSYEPHALANQFDLSGASLSTKELIRTETRGSESIRFRAYAPEPSFEITSREGGEFEIQINNLAADILLGANNPAALLDQQIEGITHTLKIQLEANTTTKVEFNLPELSGYTFAAIGDTGGDKELEWCLQRAADLGARFFLHLGDFNYQEGDYQRAIELFDQSKIPCYISIGNHDFHDSGLLHARFRSELGPLNNTFIIGKTRFANIDTAANTLPYSAGHRGELFKQLAADPVTYADTVAFTHRPVYDPAEDSHHDIGSTGERDWLIAKLKEVGVKTLLSGHIHIFSRGNFHGLENIIAGQGLGHQDLIVNRDYSKMLMGSVADSGGVTYYTEPLSMPMNLHCHPRSDVVKQSLVNAEHYPEIEKINAACLKSTR